MIPLLWQQKKMITVNYPFLRGLFNSWNVWAQNMARKLQQKMQKMRKNDKKLKKEEGEIEGTCT